MFVAILSIVFVLLLFSVAPRALEYLHGQRAHAAGEEPLIPLVGPTLLIQVPSLVICMILTAVYYSTATGNFLSDALPATGAVVSATTTFLAGATHFVVMVLGGSSVRASSPC